MKTIVLIKLISLPLWWLLLLLPALYLLLRSVVEEKLETLQINQHSHSYRIH